MLRRGVVGRMKLWAKADVRPIRFHDIRPTTASLLLMSGANPAAVQRILRHSDPRLTTEVYGHLLPGYLRSEIDRLTFVCHRRDFGPYVVQDPSIAPPEPASAEERQVDQRLSAKRLLSASCTRSIEPLIHLTVFGRGQHRDPRRRWDSRRHGRCISRGR